MPTGKTTKASDKSQICRKVVVGLHKLYGKSLPRLDMPVLETLLFAICLEDNSWPAAEAAYKKLIDSYFDLNEIRVTSVLELEAGLQPLRHADWKGLRIRSLLRHVFESTYSFEFEKFRRLTQEAAVKALKKVDDLSPFVRDFSLQHLLGSHMVCLDQSMLTACQWLGLVPLELDATAAGEHLKAGLKKSEVAEFSFLIRSLATDPRFIERFADMPTESLDMSSAPSRLTELQSPPKKPSRSAVEKKKETPPAPAQKASNKPSAAAKSSGKTSAKSTPATPKPNSSRSPLKTPVKSKTSGRAASPSSKTGSSASTKSQSGTARKAAKTPAPTPRKKK